MTTTPRFFASFWKAAVAGPGIFSASRKLAWSSLWQKYCELEKLLRADDLGAPAGGLVGEGQRLLEVGRRVGGAGVLQERDGDLAHLNTRLC